ncbi:MAG: U32 family peptidase [Alphaproteobacteria bacterium]|nr:U32 family peptidase [Alphaproteobacteria bacterium]
MTARRKKAKGTKAGAALTLGPVLYNWQIDRWRDFYFRMADEAPVDTVVLGEVVCSKRAPFFESTIPKVVERLQAGGKEVVFATLALVTNRREMKAIEELAADGALAIEANDVSALSLLAGRPHDVGPHVNVYNEGTLAWLAGRGARRVTLPVELARDQIAAIAKAGIGVELEVFAFGRLPLALSARCYTARDSGLRKDNCQFVCGGIVDGVDLATQDGKSFLAVNGTTTMSFAWAELSRHAEDLRRLGVRRFRLSPQGVDMAAVARSWRDHLDGKKSAAETAKSLAALAPKAVFADGFYRGTVGAEPVAA